MSVIAIIPPYILNNEELLFKCLGVRVYELSAELREGKLREAVLLDYHHWNREYPDHIIKNLWEAYIQSPRGVDASGASSPPIPPATVLGALECLHEEYLQETNGETYVKLKEFGWWQNMLSHISALPLQAYAEMRFCRQNGIKPKPYARGSSDYSRKHGRMHLHPYEPSVENYIRWNGLHDTHLHINLCLTADEDWLDALEKPDEVCRGLERDIGKKPALKELIRQVHPRLTPDSLFEHLLAAKAIRTVLIRLAYDETNQIALPEQIRKLPMIRWRERNLCGMASTTEAQRVSTLSTKSSSIEERDWMVRLLIKLHEAPDSETAALYHLYLLLLNEHHNLFTQSENCVGFQQFQKNADFYRHEVGTVPYFRNCFINLHGGQKDSAVVYLNARIAPKSNADDLKTALSKILTGYYQYLRQINNKYGTAPAPICSNTPLSMGRLLELLEKEKSKLPPGLRIVNPEITIHFIKKPYTIEGKNEGLTDLLPVPHYNGLRQEYSRQCKVIAKLLDEIPPLRDWIKAVDAAASELDTPPYVFAPVFRAAREDAHIPLCVFHAGEDFPHLVSGIRAVHEAVTLLGMRDGDRIGHATALGIDPELWLQSLPDALTPRCGDWLQDLAFAWDILRTIPGYEGTVARIDSDLRDLAGYILEDAKLAPHDIVQLMRIRALDPEALQKVLRLAKEKAQRASGMQENPPLQKIYQYAHGMEENEFRLSRLNAREIRLVLGAIATMPDNILHLGVKWHYSRRIREKGLMHTTVPTDYFSAKELLLLQQETSQLVCERGVVLETLPTSNIRISQYREMREHHAMRWLKVATHAKEGDAQVIVTLGDDDPGVFSTSIKGEFYHLFTAMKRCGLSASEALKRLEEVNGNAEKYMGCTR